MTSSSTAPRRLDGATVVFDLDGTLVDTAPDLIGTLNTLLAQEGLSPLPVESAPLFVGQGAKVMIEKGFAASGEPLDEDRAARLFDRYIDLYLGRIAEHSAPYPNVLAALDRLDAEGARLVVCTNKRTDLSRALMDALNLTSRFAAIVAPAPKPDGRHLLTAIAQGGGEPSRAVMVGDSLNDVLSARNAGVPVVLVSFGYTTTPAAQMDRDVLIDDFADLYPAVLRLIPAP